MKRVTRTVVIAEPIPPVIPLRERIQSKAQAEGMGFYCPDFSLCTDNAAMIGCAAFYEYKNGVRGDMSLNAVPNLTF